MRLTLHKLLAYLDDTLEPGDTKQIGQQVSESSSAQELIARIKEVVRRRRLATPSATGADARLDANTVAEFIDGDLPADRQAEVEEVCLQDDVYLAEVAACHQIMTVIMSEPARVPPTAKGRMYSLSKGRESIQSRRAASASRPDQYALEVAGGEGHHGEDDALLLGLPLYLRPGSWLRRLAPWAGALVLLAAVVAVVWINIPTGETPEPRRSRRGDQVAQNADPGKERTPDKTKTGDDAKETAGEPKPEVKPAEKPEAKSAATPPIPEPAPTATIPAITVAPPIKVDSGSPVTAPSMTRRPAGKVLAARAEPAVLLQRSSDKDPWQRVMADATVNTNDQLLSLPGYKSEIALPSGVGLAVWGNLPEGATAFTLESLVVLHEAPAGELDADLSIDRGRVAVVNDKADGPARVRVRFNQNKEVWDLTLLQPQAEVRMEVWGRYPEDVKFKKDGGETKAAEPGEEKLEGPMHVAGLFMFKGQANLKVRYDTWLLREPPGRNFYSWDNMGPAAREPTPWPAEKLPGWTRKTPPETPKELMTLREGARAALADLDKRLAPTVRVDEALTDASRVKEPRTVTRMLAIYCMGAVGDLPGLLEGLGNPQYRDVRQAAIMALRHWMGLKNENDMILYRALDSKFKGNSAEIIMSLLHGYTSDADRLDPATYDTLIHYLKNEKLPIREMAIGQLTMLVPSGAEKIPYDPSGSPDQRDQAFNAWKRLIPDGSLPPNLRTPPPSNRGNEGR